MVKYGLQPRHLESCSCLSSHELLTDEADCVHVVHVPCFTVSWLKPFRQHSFSARDRTHRICNHGSYNEGDEDHEGAWVNLHAVHPGLLASTSTNWFRCMQFLVEEGWQAASPLQIWPYYEFEKQEAIGLLRYQIDTYETVGLQRYIMFYLELLGLRHCKRREVQQISEEERRQWEEPQNCQLCVL